MVSAELDNPIQGYGHLQQYMQLQVGRGGFASWRKGTNGGKGTGREWGGVVCKSNTWNVSAMFVTAQAYV